MALWSCEISRVCEIGLSGTYEACGAYDYRQSFAAVAVIAHGTGFGPGRVRKVRTAQGTVLDNVQAEQSDGKCNRKDTAGE